MNRRHLLLCALSAPFSSHALAATATQERTDWSALFSEAAVQGTVVVVDGRRGREATLLHDPQRAARRYTPASTFKIPHTLFALDAGILQGEFQQIAWDGVKRSVPAWNADQDLRSAMRNSTVWVYERFAAQLGPQREKAYLERIGYGNAAVSGAAPFWVEGDLAISAHEQIAMLRALYRNELPFRVDHQRLVKDVMIVEAGRDWIVRAEIRLERQDRLVAGLDRMAEWPGLLRPEHRHAEPAGRPAEANRHHAQRAALYSRDAAAVSGSRKLVSSASSRLSSRPGSTSRSSTSNMPSTNSIRRSEAAIASSTLPLATAWSTPM